MLELGRFSNVDPLAEYIVYNSPHAFSENKVTNHIELEGLRAVSAPAEFRASVPVLGAVGITTSHAVGVAADVKGNVGLYYNGSPGQQVGAGVTDGFSGGVNFNAEDIYGLEGYGASYRGFVAFAAKANIAVETLPSDSEDGFPIFGDEFSSGGITFSPRSTSIGFGLSGYGEFT
ncbi:MAG: hypothetical protein AAGJ93_17070 [Bacteroidota bacterium]